MTDRFVDRRYLTGVQYASDANLSSRQALYRFQDPPVRNPVWTLDLAELRGDERVLDVGCGSGILSICAGLLGAAHVLGVDTDPLAVETTRSNARLNGLSRAIEARTGSVPLADDETHFDIVLANLIASLLVDLAVPLSYVVRPGGRLVASGIFRDREPDVRNAFESAGLRIVDRRSETDWVALVAERPA